MGASLAGLRAAEALRREGYIGRITMLGDEPEDPYDRPPLSKEVLRGEQSLDDIRLPGSDELDATWKLGSPAVALDPDAQVVISGDGERIEYDGLILATGSSARTLPVFNATRPDVHTIRTINDAQRLTAALQPGTRLLIVGCGFVGVEVASSATSLGAEVTAISMDPPVVPAGPLASDNAARLLRQSGVELHLGHTVAQADPTGPGYRVTTSTGDELATDHVVVAVGSVPNVGWLASAGIDVSNGLQCDETLHVIGLENVVAAGDIVSWPNATFGGSRMRVEHWSNAVEQAGAAAKTLLAGAAAVPFASIPSFWSDHFGIRLQSVGLPGKANRFEVTGGDVPSGVFCAEAYTGDVLVGGVSYGMPRPLLSIRMKLARHGVALEPVQD
ncbi:NAD(P)/FAD-dependent oxidoreductase [Nocardia sp. NPDC050408]|uniref:NAD(P)/FAD-dependent oxidoreductase n=1 Tax=Nocardia sp. NPDC050408 TaxID=3364319 RepID=UPI0037BA3F6E